MVFVSKREGEAERADVRLVDLREPAVALLGVVAAVGEPARGLVGRGLEARVVDGADVARGESAAPPKPPQLASAAHSRTSPMRRPAVIAFPLEARNVAAPPAQRTESRAR